MVAFPLVLGETYRHPAKMSVHKHSLAPECQLHAKEHIIVDSVNGELTTCDVTALRKSRDQRVLTLNHIYSDSLAFLEKWYELRSLKMYGCKIRDCNALTTLRKLKDLWYHTDRDRAPDLSFLSGLKHIESLGIGYVTHLAVLPDLSQCKRLKTLSIFNCRGLQDIDSATKIPNLQSFSIDCTPQSPRDSATTMTMKTLKTVSAAFGSRKNDEEFHRLLEKHDFEFA